MTNNYIQELPEDARQIENALTWVDPRGNVYGIETRMTCNRFTKEKFKNKNYGMYFKYATIVNNHNGYVYTAVKYLTNTEGVYKKITKRVHVLIAKAFLENPDNLPVVGHKNNIKHDNRVENLYWTTVSENTQKAVDDGLLVNAKSYDDSQSNPVFMFDTYTNELIAKYGSCREAHQETGIPLSTISRQAKYKHPVRKPFYFRFQDDAEKSAPTIVVEYDLKTHAELGRYWNSWEASRKTGINSKNIQQQCKNNTIPPWTKSGTYFLYHKDQL